MCLQTNSGQRQAHEWKPSGQTGRSRAPLGRAICQKHFGTGWLDGVPCGDRPDERVAVWEEELGLGLL